VKAEASANEINAGQAWMKGACPICRLLKEFHQPWQ